MNSKTIRRYSLGACCLAAVVAMGASDAVAQPGRSGQGRGRGEERIDHAPSVGDEAPNFKLKSRDGKLEVELASFRGKKPVVMIFGSYT